MKIRNDHAGKYRVGQPGPYFRIVYRHGRGRTAGLLPAHVWLSNKGGAWLLLPAGISLLVFVWLLTLHPAASGRVYATYGAIYIATALAWLWLVDGVTPAWTDIAGVGLALAGAAVIAMGHKPA